MLPAIVAPAPPAAPLAAAARRGPTTAEGSAIMSRMLALRRATVRRSRSQSPRRRSNRCTIALLNPTARTGLDGAPHSASDTTLPWPGALLLRQHEMQQDD